MLNAHDQRLASGGLGRWSKLSEAFAKTTAAAAEPAQAGAAGYLVESIKTGTHLSFFTLAFPFLVLLTR